MPVLPFPDDLSLERQFYWLKAHMQYPDSPGTALYHFVRDLVGNELSNMATDTEITLPVQWVRALALGPLLENEKKRGIDRHKAGTTAGLCLCFLFVMNRSGKVVPSLNKAIHLIEAISEKKVKHGIAREHYMERKDILQAWKLMKNAAHFWAAIELMDMTGIANDVKPGVETMGLYMRCAVALRQFACQYVPSHAKPGPPIVDPEQSLALPAEIERNPIAFNELPIPQWMGELLSEYRAPMRI